MNGNGITTESVQHYQPVTRIGRFPQLQPSVSEHDVEGDSLAIDYISEVLRIARDVHHGGIDFVKSPALVRPGINRGGARAETHNCHLLCCRRSLKGSENRTDWAGAMLVREGLAPAISSRILATMNRAAMDKGVHGIALVALHS